MAASAAVPRKAATSARETATPNFDGFLQLPHDFFDQSALLAKTHSALWLLGKLLSLVNQRSAFLKNHSRPITAATTAIRPSQLLSAAFGVWEEGQIRNAIRELADRYDASKGDDANGAKAFTCFDVQTAVQLGLLNADDSIPKRLAYEGMVFLENRGAWPKLMKDRRREIREEREARAARAAAVDDSIDDDDEPGVIRITEKPFLREPGKDAPPVPVGRQVEAIAVTGTAPACMVGLSINKDSVLEVRVDMPESHSVSGVAAASVLAPLRAGAGRCEMAQDLESGPIRGIKSETTPHCNEGSSVSGKDLIVSSNLDGTPHSTEGSSRADFFSLDDYPDFVVSARKKFPPTTNSLLFKIVEACRKAAMMAGLEPDWASDQVLTHGIRARGVTPKLANGAGFWLKGKGEEPGTLVRCISNWAQEFVQTGSVDINDFSPAGEKIRGMLEAMDGQW